MRIARWLLLWLIVVSLAPASAQRGVSRFDSITETARHELEDTQTPGAAIAVVEGDRMVFATGVGVADVETAAPVKPEMLFRLGSTTKMFTAAALVALTEERGISLDSPIGGIVSGLYPQLARLTPHQLLSHTGGLRDGAQMLGRHDDEALETEIRAMKASAFFSEPGAVHSYANPGYWIAGFVAEQIAGKAYADVMQQRVFTPLGMSRSTFRPTMAMTYPLAQGHDAPASKPPFVIRPAADNAANWPAGSMFSNVQDLSRFVAAFMNNGRVDGREVLPPAVIAKLSAPHASIPGDTSSYGYGLTIAERRGIRILMHGGSRSGYGSTIMMAPDRRAGVIVVANRTGSGMPRTTQRAMEIVLDLPAGSLAPQKTPARSVPTVQDLRAWAGRYSQGDSASLEIVVQDARIVCRDGARELRATPSGDLRLAVSAGDGSDSSATWTLVPDRDGKPAYVFRGGRAYKRVEP